MTTQHQYRCNGDSFFTESELSDLYQFLVNFPCQSHHEHNACVNLMGKVDLELNYVKSIKTAPSSQNNLNIEN